MRSLAFAIALLCSVPSFANHPTPPPPAPAPTPTPEVVGSSPWLFVAMALPIVGFAAYHCWATRCLDKK